jgi:ADP-ribosyl-[dinitrogen reductase] hydrolase
MTKAESEVRAEIAEMSTIKYWIENDIEIPGSMEEMPIPHHIPISYIKKPFLWSLYYLKNNKTYEEAITDIISRGGDTQRNAAIVGGMIGAANSLKTENL